MTIHPSRTLTVGDVARALGVDIKTVHNWIRKGQGPDGFVTPGGHRRFEAATVVAWLRARNMPVPSDLERAA